MRPDGAVVVLPSSEGRAGMGERDEQRLVQKLVAQAAVERLDEGVLLRLAGRDVVPDDRSWLQRRTAMLVNSVPLWNTMLEGRPRRATVLTVLLSSHATRPPEIEVSATRPRHSRVKSSTTARIRNRRPSVKLSLTKSKDQRGFGPCGNTSSALMPSARLRPLQRRT